MKHQQNIKDIVKEKYGAIAEESKEESGGCGCCCGSKKKIIDYTIMADNYSKLDGYAKEADFRAQTHKVYNDSAIEFTVLNN